AGASPPSGDVADSWSGISPGSIPGLSHRAKTVVWAAVSASLAITGISAYQLLDRSPESRSTATVLAPKGTPGLGSAAHAAAEAPKTALGRAPTKAPASPGAEPTGLGD